jgi:hypothetical protein
VELARCLHQDGTQGHAPFASWTMQEERIKR